ncbi:MAG: hypothetical protein KAW01_02995, partial [Deltaproteobacteria bacterium]|nr:hypothetical protein [Deltaproteobacteria bacterium]
YSVHKVLGCMGCHEAKAGTVIGTSGLASSSDLGQCDPAKGIAPFSSVWGKTDGSVKTCEFCHLQAAYDPVTGYDSRDYGAPDPTAKHQQYGLTAIIASTTNDGGPANASHMDILDCAACHVGKVSTDLWNNGGCVVDATGGDLFDRLADHENEYVHRSMFIDTTTFGPLDAVPDSPNITFSWLKGKIIATSALTTLYYRDKNDAGHDLNSDGMTGGMDAILMTHLMKANEDNYGFNVALTELDHGNLNDTNVGNQISYLNTNIGAINGNPGTPDVLLSAMSVPFKVQHNIAPVGQYVLGTSCDDCHSGTGILARQYNLVPDNLTFSVTGAVSTPLTKANGTDADVTTFHPNLKDRKAGRSIARNYTATGGLGTIQVSQMLYEDNFKTRVPFVAGPIYTGDISAFNAYGNYLRLELTDGVTSWKRNIKFGVNPTTGTTNIQTAMGTFGTFNAVQEFTVAIVGNTLEFDPTVSGLSIRFDSLTGAGFGVLDQVFDDTYTITGVNGLMYDGHNDWVTYLTGGFAASAYGVGVAPTASISGLPATVQVGDVVALTAGASAAANSQYFWTVNDMSEAVLLGDSDPLNDTDPHDPADGQTSSWTFNYPGTWKVLLTVVSPDGQLAQQMDEIQVLRDLADTTFTDDGDGDGILYGSAGIATFGINLGTIPAAHDELYFFYGDGTRLSEAPHSAATYSANHDYRLRNTFLKLYDPDTGAAHDPLNDPTPGNEYNAYVYQLSVQVKNVGAIVEIVNVQVVIPQ